MTKYYLIFLSLFCLTSSVFSQSEWINHDLTYYKIPTSTDGVYRLSYTTLSASGVNMEAVDPRDIRVYHRGEEVAIYVHGQQDGRFDSQDYIELIGKRNDGEPDIPLYPEPEHMGNPYFNNHSDATAFFLTVTPGIRGKRMAQRAEYSAAPSIQTYENEVLRIYSEQYSLGSIYPPGVYSGVYDRGQGWMSRAITRGNQNDINLTELGNIAPGPITLEIGLIGRSNAPHMARISVGPNGNSLRVLGEFPFNAFDYLNVEETLLASDISGDGRLTIRISPVSQEGSSDNISYSHVRLRYSQQKRQGDFDQAFFLFAEGESNITLNGISQSYIGYDVTDLANVASIALRKNGNTLSFPAGKAIGQSKILVQQIHETIEPNVLEKVRFRRLLDQAADYIILTHNSLRQATSINTDPVAAYAAYRHSPQGGGYDTLVVTAGELYNQFNYGEKSPLAIKTFLRQFYARHQPEYLLLMGRGYGMFNARNQGGVTHFYRNNPDIFPIQDLVPPYGYPYNDNRYAVGLDPSNPNGQDIAIGRIPAKTPEEINDYLAKVKEKDALGVSEPWQKEIVHLSGGLSAFELERYYNFVQGFEATAEGIYYGANVTTFRKRSNASVELINISDEINRGASLVTFFGHAAPATTDIDIGFVSVDELGYDNKGKYPVFLLNGCDAGNSFGNAYTFGEDWILTPDRGASNFMAHANVGVDIYLRRYSESFYTKAFSDSTLLHQSIGKVKLEAEKFFYNRYGTSVINQSHANQFIMLGDPANKIFPASKADYSLSEEEVTLSGFNGEVINALTDSLQLSIVVRNIGRAALDTVELKVTRQLPDGTLIPYDAQLVPPIYYRDTVNFIIPNTGIASAGDNFFTIEINKDQKMDELTFANNAITITEFIQSSGPQNLYPLDFAIHNKTQVEMMSQIPGKATADRTLIMQIDTTPEFSSANRKESRITTPNIARWNLDLAGSFIMTDTTTFYWRTRFLDPKEGETPEWTVSSFTYIPEGPEGWIQRQLSQLDQNHLTNLEVDFSKREWKYKDTKLHVDVFTFGANTPGLGVENTQLQLDGVSYILNSFNRFCPNGSLGLMAFDQRTLAPYLVIPLTNFDVLDERSCGRTPQIIQNIRNVRITGGQVNWLVDYVEGLKDGDYVVIFSVGNVTFEDWPDEAFLKMREIGANEATLRNLKTGDPYILFGRKGMKPGEATEILADKNIDIAPDEQIIQFETNLKGFFSSGSIVSSRVGPASEWVEFFNHARETDAFNTDLSKFDVIGVSQEGAETLLFENIQEGEVRLSEINADAYPYLRLHYTLSDQESNLPEQLQQWQVNYTGVPEGVLIINTQEDNFQLQEGEQVTVGFEFINISNYDFTDSLTVRWGTQNLNTRTQTDSTFKIPAVKAGESQAFSITFNSLGKAGRNALNVFVNPREYLEQSYKNNVMDLPDYFLVDKDDANPILDVSFDGVYIMDGDIVSPNVLIAALMKDENETLYKKDTVGVEVHLKHDCEECISKRIYFSNPSLKWFEASENSDYKLEFQPGPLEDGVYTLRINAEDVAGNKAGEKPYEIHFEVINESQITHFYPYPNPFSTSVRFVFTVTGAEPPDQIKIQIMTVTGKVVREILQDELGPIHIGHNMTEYAWDGKDEYGDQLANGVYIYRVLVRKDGQFVEHRPTAGDKGFKKGYGKMYLLR